jgi:hypothetical protein
MLAAWTLAVWATVPVARPISEALRAAGWLTALVTAGLAACALGTAWMLYAQRGGERPGPGSAAAPGPWLLLLTAAAGALLARSWELPEERVHLAEYLPLGVLAFLAMPAGGASGVPRARRVLLAILLIAALGAADELLQHLVPQRQFDRWDVAANAVSGASGVLLAAGGRLAWGAPAILVAAAIGMPALRGSLLAPQPGGPTFAPGRSRPPAASPEGVDRSAPYASRSVLFVTFDALRADVVPPWGSAPFGLALPAFERLARESVTPGAALANAHWTSPAMVSFFTALLPPAHGVERRGVDFAPGPVTPLETLAAAGWRVIGTAGDGDETYGNLGIRERLPAEAAAGAALRADPVSAALAALADGDRPSFVWLHRREIHAPYEATPERLRALSLPERLPAAPILDRARTAHTVPRADFPGRHGWLRDPIRALYAAELADADATLGRILAGIDDLGARGVAAPILLVSADHGEELLERDGIGHASTTLDSWPWPELVNIPLWIRLPDGLGAGVRLPGRMEQVDLMPTLLPLLGLRAEEPVPGIALDGRDLSVPLLAAARAGSGAADLGPGAGERAALASGTPCGWQCPPERRAQRVHMLHVGDVPLRCDDSPDISMACDPRIQGLLDDARGRAVRLRTPVRHESGEVP